MAMIETFEDLTDCSDKNIYSDTPLTEWQKVFRFVIRELILDLKSKSKKKEKIELKKKAKLYIQKNSEDFEMVCHLAGFDEPIYVFQKVKKYADKY